MSARFQRRTFAAPFVLTLAGCMVQSAPPSRPPPQEPHMNPPPPNDTPATETTPPPTTGPTTGVISNPPRPGAEQQTPDQAQPKPPKPDTYEAHWTVMKQGDRCVAYVKTSCPPGAMCNPPPPTDYVCTADITPQSPLKIERRAGQATCIVEPEPMNCPPNTMCNPPRPRQVACPR